MKAAGTPAKTPKKEEIEEKAAQALQEAAKRSSGDAADVPDNAVRKLFDEEEDAKKEVVKKKRLSLAQAAKETPEALQAIADAALAAACLRQSEMSAHVYVDEEMAAAASPIKV